MDGPGELLVLSFVTLAVGTSPIIFHDVDLRDLENNAIPATAIDGTVVVSEIVPVEERSWTIMKLMYR